MISISNKTHRKEIERPFGDFPVTPTITTKTVEVYSKYARASYIDIIFYNTLIMFVLITINLSNIVVHTTTALPLSLALNFFIFSNRGLSAFPY